MARPRLVAGNWKMNCAVAAARTLAQAIRRGLEARGVSGGPEGGPEVVLFPPYVSIPVVVESLAGSALSVGGQDLHWEASGAFTGAVSGPMLRESGATHVLVGHSERRRLFGETDEEVARKTRAALAAGLIPVVCVGESLEERERGDTRAVLERQFALGPGAIAAGEWGTLVLAYEPVWAIGTGRNATPEVAEAAHVLLRGLVRQHAGEARAGGQRIIYGGSVTAENAAAYFREEDVDGVLVGGASLKADAFLQIVTSASAEGAAQ